MRGTASRIRFGVAAGAVIVAAVAGALFDGDAARPSGTVTISIVAAIAGAIALAVAATGSRAKRVVAAIVAVAAAAAAVWVALAEVGRGTPGPFLPVLAATAVVFAVALIALCFGPDAASPSPWPAAVAAAGTIVVIVGAATLLADDIRRLPERARTADMQDAPPIPQIPTEVAWSFEVPDSTFLRWEAIVVAAGAGVVTLLDHPDAPEKSVVAVDGATGEARWWYRLEGGHVRDLVATPDGTVVVATFAPGGRHDTDRVRMVTFDAFTGDVLAMRTLHDLAGLAPTNHTVVLPARALLERNSNDIVAVDLRSGDERWRRHAPDGCRFETVLEHSTARSSLHALQCADEAAVIAYDGATGDERWRRTVTTDDLGITSDDWWADTRIRTAPDSDRVFVRILGRGDTGGVVDSLVDDTDGRDLPLEPEIRIAGPTTLTTPPRGDEMILGPDATRWRPAAWSAERCGTVDTVATTREAVLVSCHDENGADQPPFVATLEGTQIPLPFGRLYHAVTAPGAAVVVTQNAYVGLR